MLKYNKITSVVLLSLFSSIYSMSVKDFSDAMNSNNFEKIKILLKKCPNINAPLNSLGWPALQLAAYKGNKEVIELLLNYGADIKAKAKTNWTPLHVAIFYAKSEECAMFLLDKGFSNINAKDAIGNTALYLAIVADFRNLVKYLLQKGADISDSANQLLNECITEGNISMAKVLLDNGADIDAKDEEQTLFYNAVRNNDINRVNLLIGLGADVNCKNGINHNTALHWAASSGLSDKVKLLLDLGADKNMKNKLGYIPTTLARNPEIIELINNYVVVKCR